MRLYGAHYSIVYLNHWHRTLVICNVPVASLSAECTHIAFVSYERSGNTLPKPNMNVCRTVHMSRAKGADSVLQHNSGRLRGIMLQYAFRPIT